jgi:hypothetical protein
VRRFLLQMRGAVLLLLPMLLASCLYVGATARTTVDLETRKPVYAAYGYFGGFSQQGINDKTVTEVDDRHGGYFALSTGVIRDQRLERWMGLVGPRFGWLWPHGFTEIGVDVRLSASDPEQLVGVIIAVGPRITVRRKRPRSPNDNGRSASVVSGGAAIGFSAGDGFRPEAGAAVGFHHQVWAPTARYY